MSQHRPRRKNSVPTGVWILAALFVAIFVIPLATSGGATDNTLIAVIACLGGLVGSIVLFAKFVIPRLGKAAQRGIRLASDFDQQLIAQQKKTLLANRSLARTVTTGHRNVIITSVGTNQPVAELPLPDQWEQIRRQMFLLGYDDGKAIPKTALLTPMIVIEDPINDQQRTVVGRLLIEQLLTKADEIAVCVITTSHIFDNLPTHFDNIYLVGAPEGKTKLPETLHAYYGEIASADAAHSFCQTLMDNGDHAIFNLATYSQEKLAFEILANILCALFGMVSTSTRQCILILDKAHNLLPNEQRLGMGTFSDASDAKQLCEDMLIMHRDGPEAGLYTYLLTSQPTDMDIRAVFECKFWIVNKVLSTEEAQLVQGRMLAEPHEIERLNRETLFTEDINSSPIKSIVLRPCATSHKMPAKVIQQPKVVPSPAQKDEIITTPVETKQATIPASREKEETILPEMLQYVWYVRLRAPDFYSADLLADPPDDLYPILEALGLADIYDEKGHVFSECTALALMHRTEDQPDEGKQIASEVHTLIRAFQDGELIASQSIIDEGDADKQREPEKSYPVAHSQKTLSALPVVSVFQMTVENGSPWKMPTTALLEYGKEASGDLSGPDPEELASTIRQLLTEFKVYAEVLTEDIKSGPTIIRFGIRPTGKPLLIKDAQGQMIPARDKKGHIRYETRTRTARIMALQNDLALVLEAKSIRMEAPVPGQPYVGVEIPNSNSRIVTLREVLETQKYKEAVGMSKLVFGLGQDVAGQVCIPDLAKMPHLLIAGATGSGKSVLINAIIASILYNATPDEVKFWMVDPKMVELKVYDGIPHLMQPVVTEIDKVVPLLQQAVTEMERRYRLFSQLGVRNLDGYRKIRRAKLAQSDNSLGNLPAIVIIIDELADLMMTAAEEVEKLICRLAQLARATGIHLIVATQRPSVDVITGTIKANLPIRISFMVSSAVDSRTIIDMGGAERLLGRGDMLYLPSEAGRPERIQGAFLSDDEAQTLADYWRSRRLTERSDEQRSLIEAANSPNTQQDLLTKKTGGETLQTIHKGGAFATGEEEPAESPTVAATSQTHNPLAPIPDHLLPLIERIAQGEHIRVRKEDRLADNRTKDESRNDLQLLVTAYLFRHGSVSTTGVQRRFHVGYGIASEIIENLEEIGILEPYQGKAEARCLTQDRGGNNLPEALILIRDLVDQKLGANENHHTEDTRRTDELDGVNVSAKMQSPEIPVE